MEQSDKEQAKKALEEQLVREVQLINDSDPDWELKKDFESASLTDLRKYSDAEIDY